jgi:cullin-associated NEDD8-dissociated protein 1
LRAVVESKKNNPSSLWKTEYAVCGYKSTTVAAALVARFKEREENCRIGIIDCFTRLMSLTIQASSSGVISFSSPDEMDTSSALSIDLRNYYARKLVKACEKILAVKKGIERSKSSALALLATLCKAPGGVGGESEIASVFRLIKTLLTNCGDEQALREGVSKTLRLDALSLVYAILTSNQHDPVHIRKSLRQSLIPELCDAVKEKWYKVIAEALRTLAAVPSFFVTGYSKNDDGATKKKEQVEVASLLYAAIEPLLAAHDVDQEIKECALKACGTLLTYLHDSLDKESESRLLQLLLERLNNETTRLYAIKTFASIAASARDDSADDKHIDLSSIVAKSISDLASCLKLQSRSVRQSALEALDIVVTNHSTLPDLANGELFSSVVQDLATMMNDSDLHLSHLSL